MLEIKDLTISISDRYLIKNLNLILNNGDKLAIIGEEGNGKSTLLKSILGICEYAEISGNINLKGNRIGYLEQSISNDKLDKSVYEFLFIDDTDYYDKINNLYKYLEIISLTDDILKQEIRTLSGGEKVKISILKLLLNEYDILFLDEPTNDLDIQTLNILEDYLDNFNGVVITVSHDRYFLDRTCDYVFAFENGNINYYVGGYSDYYEQKQKESNAPKEKINYTEYKKQQHENKPYLSSKDKKELENMENVILELEAKIEEIDTLMNTITDYEKIHELSIQRSKIEEEIELKNERWMELLEIEEQIKNSR